MLPKYQSILVPSDLTPNSANAFKHAVMLARQHDAKIYLLHVVAQIDNAMRGYMATVLGDERLKDFEQKNEQQALIELKKELDDFAREELADYPEDLARFAGTEVLIGNPVIKIIEVARRMSVDVIVMGTHSKGPLEHAFLGSTAERVINKAIRPVFLVPLPKR